MRYFQDSDKPVNAGHVAKEVVTLLDLLKSLASAGAKPGYSTSGLFKLLPRFSGEQIKPVGRLSP